MARTWVLIAPSGEPISHYTQCPGDPEPSAETATPTPTVTPGQVLRAFERIPLPESEIVVQPPDGETLVNSPTIFSTDAEPFSETVTFFGGRITVVLDIEASEFTWRHGDGSTQTTSDPGREWTRGDGTDLSGFITHVYNARDKDVPVAVDTTWSATWSLNGRDMGAVPGTVTMEGEAEPLDVLEARPVLVH